MYGTPMWLLATTIVVSVIHMAFDVLAVKVRA